MSAEVESIMDAPAGIGQTLDVRVDELERLVQVQDTQIVVLVKDMDKLVERVKELEEWNKIRSTTSSDSFEKPDGRDDGKDGGGNSKDDGKDGKGDGKTRD